MAAQAVFTRPDLSGLWPAFLGWDIRVVGHPYFTRSTGLKRLLKSIGGHRQGMLGIGRDDFEAPFLPIDE